MSNTVREFATTLRQRVRLLFDPPAQEPGDGPLTRLTEVSTTFMRRHLALMDSLLALAVLGAGLLNNLPGGAPVRVALFSSLLALPLIGRRRAPILVFLFIAAVAFVQWLADAPLFADIALFVALCSVAAARPPRVAIAATAVLEGGALLATIHWSTNAPWIQTFALLSGAVLAAVVSGVHMQARRLHVASLVERAQRLEFERDQQARLAATAERARIAREMHDMSTLR